MMNRHIKFKTFFLSLLAIYPAIASAQESCCEQEAAQCYFSQPMCEVKAGYFFFSDSSMRKIYDKGGLDVQLCASYPLWNLSNSWTLNAYGAVEYLHLSGKSVNAHQNTSLWSIPVNIGLRPVYTVNDAMQYYLAVGLRYFYIHQHINSSYMYKNRSKNGLGFFANTGFNCALYDRLVIDIFGEYSYAKVHFHGGNSNVYTKDVQVGGFTFGGGLGYKF
jgi:opacity protein-like surface antigen